MNDFFVIDPSRGGPLVYCSKNLESNLAFTNERLWATRLSYAAAQKINQQKPGTIILTEEEFSKLELKQITR